ncbi:phosphodiester glycosidase family protein (plasmid) [Pontibacillus sp. ALD_SL1]|uniref:phosphodiester glycosidase family protein n=1 Tax=Pontibacillus sp. ALD_SL1 TaxID=2777185 RepID=UPI001A96A6D9|nr:phosphodiester glycosidase family protein [Pontibacillus sp. ALD_SL1]QST02046.1 phosphodiester glycosidase family protein [Pontibacillus sp. ALD_SL1]
MKEVFLLICVFGLFWLSPMHAAAERVVEVDGEGVRALKMDTSDPLSEVYLSIPSPLSSLSRTSNQAEKVNNEVGEVYGSINAGFFYMSTTKDPIYMLVQENEIIAGEILGLDDYSYSFKPIAFGITEEGLPLIDEYKTTVTFEHKGKAYNADAINRKQREGEVIIYSDHYWGTSKSKNKYAMEIVVKLSESGNLAYGTRYEGRVVEIYPYGEEGEYDPKEKHAIISIHGGDLSKEFGERIRIGDQIDIAPMINEKWMNARYIVGSGPLLVKDGEPHLTINLKSPRATAIANRTAVGVKGEDVFFITSQSAMDMATFASYVARLGVDRALNLDGGGSSSMVVQRGGQLKSVVPSNAERAVSTTLHMVKKHPPEFLPQLQSVTMDFLEKGSQWTGNAVERIKMWWSEALYWFFPRVMIQT